MKQEPVVLESVPHTCDLCRWWRESRNNRPCAVEEPGTCHRHSPRDRDDEVDFVGLGLWPQTFSTSFCGDWQIVPTHRKADP